jgi:hypothetical protein
VIWTVALSRGCFAQAPGFKVYAKNVIRKKRTPNGGLIASLDSPQAFVHVVGKPPAVVDVAFQIAGALNQNALVDFKLDDVFGERPNLNADVNANGPDGGYRDLLEKVLKFHSRKFFPAMSGASDGSPCTRAMR